MLSRNPRSELGRLGEEAAAQYLESCGWVILARNVRRREGEIDIVAGRGRVLAFIEVKSRRTRAFGHPAEAVTHRKRQRIRSLAVAMLAEDDIHADEIRFDVIEVMPIDASFAINHIEAAF